MAAPCSLKKVPIEEDDITVLSERSIDRIDKIFKNSIRDYAQATRQPGRYCVEIYVKHNEKNMEYVCLEHDVERKIKE
jgi:hypothetical protein